MEAYDKFRTFLVRRRRIRWIVAAALVIIAGHWVEAHDIHLLGLPQQGVALTDRLAERLRAVQPGVIADEYAQAAAGRHGLGACGPTARPDMKPLIPIHQRIVPDTIEELRVQPPTSLPEPTPTPSAMTEFDRRVAGLKPHPMPGANRSVDDVLQMMKNRPIHPTTPLNLRETGADEPKPAAGPVPHYWSCTSWLGMVDASALTLRVTPEVAGHIWHKGGWTIRLLFAFTLLLIGAALLSIWRNAEANGCAVIPMTLAVLTLGPLFAGGVFWVALKLLLGMIFVVGKALAGLSMILLWIGFGWKGVMTYVELIKTADELKENTHLTRDAIDTLRGSGPN